MMEMEMEKTKFKKMKQIQRILIFFINKSDDFYSKYIFVNKN